MLFPGFEEAMRRIVTGDDANGKSLVVIDGAPSNVESATAPPGLYEIWHDAASGTLDPKATGDLGPQVSMLCPDDGKVRVRWFVVHPMPEGGPVPGYNDLVRAGFEALGAGDAVADQSRHPVMHRTETLDVICVIKGEVSLTLDNEEVHRLKPGNVVIQRGTAHGWTAIGEPALLLAVLIERPLV
jgi:hypothetical protein